jgi:enoyl-CoA hydratase/carnithine racemase
MNADVGIAVFTSAEQTDGGAHSAELLRHVTVAARLRKCQDVCTLAPQLERLYLDSLMQTEDAREGIAAFVERRRPRWAVR